MSLQKETDSSSEQAVDSTIQSPPSIAPDLRRQKDLVNGHRPVTHVDRVSVVEETSDLKPRLISDIRQPNTIIEEEEDKLSPESRIWFDAIVDNNESQVDESINDGFAVNTCNEVKKRVYNDKLSLL